MHSDDDINSPSKSLAEIANQLSALSYQVGKISGDVTSTKEEISQTKKALSKIPTNSGDPSFGVMAATIFLSFIIALTSNPPKSDHLAHLAKRMLGSSDEAEVLRKIAADYVLPYLPPDLISYESYYCVSVLKGKWGGTEIPISLGIFGNVFDYKTPDEVKEKMKKLTN